MKYLLLTLLTISYLFTIAQPPGGGGQARGNFAPMAANGHFFGKIVDGKTNKGLNGATVLLLNTQKIVQAKHMMCQYLLFLRKLMVILTWKNCRSEAILHYGLLILVTQITALRWHLHQVCSIKIWVTLN